MAPVNRGAVKAWLLGLMAKGPLAYLCKTRTRNASIQDALNSADDAGLTHPAEVHPAISTGMHITAFDQVK